jgi:hypothetical protein
MRLELSGIISRADPQVIIFESNGTFDTVAYRDLGYTFSMLFVLAGWRSRRRR